MTSSLNRYVKVLEEMHHGITSPINSYFCLSLAREMASKLTPDVARGYNIFTGSRVPMSSAIDNGFKKQILLFNITSVKRFQVDGFQVLPTTICDVTFSEKEYSSWESYKYTSTSESSYAQSMPLGVFSSSASTERKEAEDKFKKEKKVSLQEKTNLF